ncbi:MAG: hypothetical protein ACW976_07585 [Candidatus Ranarchaeia archaeon]
MGTNTWETEIRTKPLTYQALKFADAVKAQGIATLLGTWIAPDKKLMWCLWETENLPGLQAAFDEMNKQSGLKSKLAEVEDFTPK